MALADIDQQLLLIQQVGDIDPISADPVSPLTPGATGIVLLNTGRLWTAFLPKKSLPVLGPEIFGYYFKRDAVSLVIAVLESRVDFSAVGTAMSVRLNQRIAARQMQSARYQTEINRLEKRLGSMTTPQGFSLITQIEPIFPPVPGQISSPTAAIGNANIFAVDGNDPGIQGSVYWPTRRRRF